MKKIILLYGLLFSLFSCTTAENTSNLENINTVSENIGIVNTSIGSSEFKQAIENKNYSVTILDVRTQEEYNKGFIEGAILLDYYENNFKEHLSLLDKDKSYYIYCRSGNRSGKTLKIMKDLGFKNVYNLEKGIIDWKNNLLPLDNTSITDVVIKTDVDVDFLNKPIQVNLGSIDDPDFDSSIGGFNPINLPKRYGFEFESEGFTFYFDGGYKKYGEKHIGFGPLFTLPESPTDRVIQGYAYEMKLVEKDENFYGEIIKFWSNDVYYKSHGGMCDLRTYVLKGKIKDIKISSSGCNTTKEDDDNYMKTTFGNFIKIN